MTRLTSRAGAALVCLLVAGAGARLAACHEAADDCDDTKFEQMSARERVSTFRRCSVPARIDLYLLHLRSSFSYNYELLPPPVASGADLVPAMMSRLTGPLPPSSDVGGCLMRELDIEDLLDVFAALKRKGHYNVAEHPLAFRRSRPRCVRCAFLCARSHGRSLRASPNVTWDRSIRART